MNIEPELTVREALSGISGSVSIAAWLFLLLPQLWENYQNQNADALSVAFLVVWFLGDITNLIGAVWDGLLPTVIAIAIYFCFVDLCLLSQTFYYKYRAYRRGEDGSGPLAANDPTRPLLAQAQRDADNEERRRSSASASQRRSSTTGSLPFVREGRLEPWRWLRNILALLALVAIGALGWTVAWRAGWWVPTPTDTEGDVAKNAGAQVMGYISALMYLGARLPQIYKNYTDKSCEGLSLLFFMLSTLGNITYGTQILFHSTAPGYVLKNLPWLIGSLGTIAEDIVIFVQFQIYAKDAQRSGSSAIAD